MSVNMSVSGAVGLGVGVGSYQPGVYVPLKALFLVFSCPSYAPFLSYVPLKTKFENLVCKISEQVFELEPSYLAYWLGLRSRSPD